MKGMPNVQSARQFKCPSEMREFLKRIGLGAVALLAWVILGGAELFAKDNSTLKPNIIFILADDLGYGDVRCLNPERGKIPTPCMDKLANQGIRFTEAHSTSSICSPSRYGILTGRYNWRSRMQAGLVGEWGAPFGDIIGKDRLTVAGLLKQNGYNTACIGKWHLGMDWPKEVKNIKSQKPVNPETGEASEEQKTQWQKIFSQRLGDGPTTRGFDYYFGTDVPNWPPYCFIENDKTVGIPSRWLPAKLLKNFQASTPGPALENWSLEAILPTLVDKACDYIERRSKESKPFFLYLPLTAPHTPLAVTDKWKGKSGLGVYPDWVMETDAAIGKILERVDQSGAAGNTLVVLTSDNGMAPYIGVHEYEKEGHYPSEWRRGYKGDAWDGGHRIPLIARWPGVIQPGTSSSRMVCLVDFMATCADIIGVKLPDNAAEDSVSILPLLKGNDKPVHEAIVSHSAGGKFAIRDGKWKLQLCPGSGGPWDDPKDDQATAEGLPPIQLYDMTQDIGEQKNVQAEHPEIVERLTKILEKYVADGRSTPGTPQSNDAKVDIWKKRRPGAKQPKAKP